MRRPLNDRSRFCVIFERGSRSSTTRKNNEESRPSREPTSGTRAGRTGGRATTRRGLFITSIVVRVFQSFRRRHVFYRFVDCTKKQRVRSTAAARTITILLINRFSVGRREPFDNVKSSLGIRAARFSPVLTRRRTISRPSPPPPPQVHPAEKVGVHTRARICQTDEGTEFGGF